MDVILLDVIHVRILGRTPWYTSVKIPKNNSSEFFKVLMSKFLENKKESLKNPQRNTYREILRENKKKT